MGLNNFMEKMNQQRQLDAMLMKAGQIPGYSNFINVGNILKRQMQLSDIPNWQELVNLNPQSPMGAPSQPPDMTGGMGGAPGGAGQAPKTATQGAGKPSPMNQGGQY